MGKLALRLASASLFWMASPYALGAAQQTPWLTYLLVVMAISLIIASVLSKRNEKAEGRMAKLLLAGLYFWVFTFAQLIVLALIYYLNK